MPFDMVVGRNGGLWWLGGEGSLWPWPFDGGRESARARGRLVVLVPWSQVPPTDCWRTGAELNWITKGRTSSKIGIDLPTTILVSGILIKFYVATYRR